MTHTVLSSATKEVVIGFDRPFVMIGERINPTGRKLLAEEMKNGDFSRVEAVGVLVHGHGSPPPMMAGHTTVSRGWRNW